ncbi:MAG: hypothetical protein KKD44_00825 [Proteobacteria bacterium]|nr:hypothetical protein [Pseudomonadota bacterium]
MLLKNASFKLFCNLLAVFICLSIMILLAGTSGCHGNSSSQIPLSWISVSVGQGFTIAIKTDGSLYAWGDNSFGKLGIGTSTGPSSPIKIE